MINLPATQPDVYEYLVDRNFSTQIGKDNPFGCMDRTIEETINKDTQTPGGTIGFSTKKVLHLGITLQLISELLALDN